MNDFGQPVTERFSSEYDIVHDVEVLSFSGEKAVMDEDMMRSLELGYDGPIVGAVGGLHYEFLPSNAVPAGSLAVPAENHDDPDTLLIQR